MTPQKTRVSPKAWLISNKYTDMPHFCIRTKQLGRLRADRLQLSCINGTQHKLPYRQSIDPL